MPKWPRGKGIAETFGWLAKLTLFVQTATFVLGQVWPNLFGGEPRVLDLILGIAFATVFGSVAYGIERDQLRISLAGLGVAIAAMVTVFGLAIARSSEGQGKISGFETMFVVICGSIFACLCALAFREVYLEMRRREASDA